MAGRRLPRVRARAGGGAVVSVNKTKKRIGRPPRPDGPTVRISTRVPGSVAEDARRLAEREGVTVGELVRVALVEFLAR